MYILPLAGAVRGRVIAGPLSFAVTRRSSLGRPDPAHVVVAGMHCIPEIVSDIVTASGFERYADGVLFALATVRRAFSDAAVDRVWAPACPYHLA
jgi:hypothetical protein